MNKNVGVSSDGGSEVGVKRSSQAIVIELSLIMVGRAEIGCFIHASCGHDPYKLIEKLISLSGDFI